MKYYFFLDETGDHSLSYIDDGFPYFLLCGCVLSEKDNEILDNSFNSLKQQYFGHEKTIFHSRDIRRCEKDFKLLFDLNTKEKFYNDLNKAIKNNNFTIIASAINKELYIKEYGKQVNNPYSISLSFVIERLIFFMDHMDDESSTIEIIVESRGKKEDKELLGQFNRIMDNGTFYIKPERLKGKIIGLEFKRKIENDNGIQLADLCAYPMVRHLIYPEASYIPYDLIYNKIYKEDNKLFGFKVFPQNKKSSSENLLSTEDTPIL